MRSTEQKAKFFKALGEPTRLNILKYLLRKDECSCICELTKLLKKDNSVIFRHIEVLRDAGIINSHKEHKYLICCIKDKEKIRKLIEG